MSEEGICAIKPEYIVSDHVREITLSCVSEKDKSELQKNNAEDGLSEDLDTKTNDGEPPDKKQRLSKSEKKKLRGQNKNRPAPFKIERAHQLCNVLVDLAENEEARKCSNPKCKFLHDVKEYLKLKPKDISDDCPNYKLKGRCPRGITCRFGSCHITPEGFNKIDKDKIEKYKEENKPTFINRLSYELLIKLRKRKYDFSLSENTVASNDKKKISEKQKTENENKNIEEVNDVNKESLTSKEEVTVKEVNGNAKGTVTDEDIIKIRPSEKKTINWHNKLYLSPLTTVGNLPFRRICKEYGADITCGEMAVCTSLLQGATQEWALVKRHPSEDIFGVQLCGNNPHIITKTAQLLQENTEVDFIDLNLGCPLDFIYRDGAGSGMLRRPSTLEAVIRCTSQLLNIPFTVKTRVGVYSNQNIAHTLIPKFVDWGVNMITVHGRSREQRYTRLADWPYIEQCAALSAPVPLFGNGDILSYDDYTYAKETYKSVAGIMIGRGALIKPWIFTEIKEQKLWDISSSERFDILKKYVNYGLEHWGSDTKGVENTRRFLLEWLSFLYRYVPVGILERPPQKINERPPTYKGRNDLETLMASASCTDWIKISEMLLGPVPQDFQFLPKHKANSYK